MATVNITTWDEFVTALTETITEDTTYEIQNDIDASDNILSTHIIFITSGYIKTFNGNDYAIQGITCYSITSTTQGVFYSDTATKTIFNNINFTGIMVPVNNHLFYLTSLTSSGYLTFNNCTFSGMCYSLCRPTQYQYSNVKFNNCGIYLKTTYLGYSSGDSSTRYYANNFNQCYIKIEPLVDGAQYECTDNFNDCYITGNVNVKYSSNYYNSGIIKGVWTGTISQNGNVWNVNTTIVNSSSVTSSSYLVCVYQSSTAGVILVNSDKIFDSDGAQITTGFNENGTSVLLSDSELQSASDINTIAPNFPLYGY